MLPAVKTKNLINNFYSREMIVVYYIQSSEIQESIDEILCLFHIFTSENINFYIYTPPE